MQAKLTRLIDAHVHLCTFSEHVSLANIITQCIDAGVFKLTENAINESSFDTVISLYQNHPEVIIPSVGIHPLYISSASHNYALKIEELLKTNYFLQVGEIGLDFRPSSPAKEIQLPIFRTQLDLAQKYNRTASIHCLRAHKELLQILKEMQEGANKTLSTPPIVLHSFSGNKKMAKSFLQLSLPIYFSFSLNSLGPKDEEVIASIPIDRILAETDSPDQLTSDPKAINIDVSDGHEIKKQLNHPANVQLVYQKIAEIKKLSFEETARQILDNFIKAFNQ